LDNTADGAWISDSEGRIRYWNRGAATILGYGAQEVAGHACADVFCGRDGMGNRICGSPCPMAVLLRRGDLVKHFAMATQRKTGELVWIDVSLVNSPSGGNEPPLTVHFFRDVTAAHQIESLVRRHLAQTELTGGDGAGVACDLLTRREMQVLALLRTGATTAAIAKKLFISTATVRNHIQNIMAKLKVHSRLEAVACVSRGLPRKPGGQNQPGPQSEISMVRTISSS
jgi:PAS domain S-box-containing protein